MLIKSKIKYIQSLSQKKLREEDRVFVAEGPKIVEEILQAPNVEVREVFATPKWIEQNPHCRRTFADLITEISDDELTRISFLHTPHQVLGLFSYPAFPTFDITDKVSLMLDTIQDPGNLGTIVRCADWFGVTQIICSQDSADIYNPKVVQATMGSVCRVHVVYEDLPSFLKSNDGVPVFAATLDGTELKTYPKISEGIILVGNESKGISADLLSRVNKRITIPRKGNAESLNAAVATGIILSHLV